MNDIHEIFLTYQHEVYNYLVYYTGKTDVEDVVQEVFIKLMRRKSDGPISKAFIFTIARHTAIDFIRKDKLLSWLPNTILESLSSTEHTPEHIVEQKEELLELIALLNQLKRSYKEVIILRKIQGLNTAEAAQILGWTESKVNLTLHRAINKLRQLSSNGEGVQLDASHI